MTQNTAGQNGSDDPIFVSVAEAAQLLGATRWDVTKLLDSRVIQSVRRVRLDSLREYHAKNGGAE